MIGLDPFLSFAPLLRSAGFAVAPDQTIGFVAAVGALGPQGPEDIRRAGLSLFAIPHERIADYDALFRAHFLGHTLPGGDLVDDDDTGVEAHEPLGIQADVSHEQEGEPSGEAASFEEQLGVATLGQGKDEGGLQGFDQFLRRRLPMRRTFRRTPDRRGDDIDLRRTLKGAMRHGGETIKLHRTLRRVRPRRLLLLIDVSGSMAGYSEPALKIAHRVVQVAERVEVFTLGTRLTRVTAALSPQEQAVALSRASQAVADFEGGTRLGEALGIFLAVPRYAALARGAAVVVVSDGLERGDPAELAKMVHSLTRLCWRTLWISPLAAEPGYRPETQAMRAIAPMVDRLEGAADLRGMCQAILGLSRLA
ncbi:VWA domain-containing protein [Mesorhizobium sp. M0830]|uniref:vWA domain-containing protein n=1 Tax=Mesorhizobium sp. M0830 TaxID=2957008 RepID=UPI0033384C9F